MSTATVDTRSSSRPVTRLSVAERSAVHQNERDDAALLAAIERGDLEARSGV
jgi:hypothetical protein